MRMTALALVATVATALTASGSDTLENAVPDKPPSGVTPPPGKFQGGDTVESCTVIDALPCYTTGTTAGFVNDYDEICPYTGSTAPDVVYCWEAGFSGYVDIHTCQSSYDTKLYVYENEYTPGDYYACNDDNASCPGPVYRSWIEQMEVVAGSTYYVVVDGYGGAFGTYLFNMYEVEGPEPCDPHLCPPDAFDENEPDCYDGYVDTTNVGCNGTPTIFQYPPFPTVICGTSGNYDVNDNAFRDMDWFSFHFSEVTDLEVCVCADFEVRVWLVQGCGGTTLMTDASAPGYELCLLDTVGPSTYYIVISTDGWLGIPCGSEYWATIAEAGVTSTQQASWGTIKALYR
jgi:hypothetical protein